MVNPYFRGPYQQYPQYPPYQQYPSYPPYQQYPPFVQIGAPFVGGLLGGFLGGTFGNQFGPGPVYPQPYRRRRRNW